MRNYRRRVQRLTGDAMIDDQLRPARIRMDRNLVALYVLLEDWLVEDPERTLRFVAVRQRMGREPDIIRARTVREMETELRKRFRRGSRRFLRAELTDALIVEARGGQNTQALLAHFLGAPIAAP